VLLCVALEHVDALARRQAPVFESRGNLFAVCCSVLQFNKCPSLNLAATWLHFVVLKCVAVCCSVLQCVAVCCCVLLCVAVCCSVFQCVAVCCCVLQCVAVCCCVLLCVAFEQVPVCESCGSTVAVCACVCLCVAVHCSRTSARLLFSQQLGCSVLQCVAVRLQCVAVEQVPVFESRGNLVAACGSVLHCVAVCCT